MNGFFVLAIFLLLYGVFCVAVGIFKIPAIWNMAKIEGFKKILGNVGTQIFLAVWGVIAIAGGIILILFNLPS